MWEKSATQIDLFIPVELLVALKTASESDRGRTDRCQRRRRWTGSSKRRSSHDGGEVSWKAARCRNCMTRNCESWVFSSRSRSRSPAAIPMTMNAIVSGANQKQNREPVLELSEGEIAKALYSLGQKRFVEQAPPAAGARVNRFGHRVVERVSWDRREQAVMAELILRGSQTPGELRTRGGRMAPIPDMAAVMSILQDLSSGERAFVEELPREPGRSATRYQTLARLGQRPRRCGRSRRRARPPRRYPMPRRMTRASRSGWRSWRQRLSCLEERLGRLDEKQPPGIDESVSGTI